MKLTALLLAFLPTLIAAECYKSGESWDRELGRAAVERACNQLAGDYRRGEFGVKKFAQNNGQCYVFELKRLRESGGGELRTITKDECKGGMNRELYGCGQGGTSSYTNWMY
ncbi:MAG: hypothetical protein L6R42_007627, partial [Xanthoria sp. 1 TBL-2021]